MALTPEDKLAIAELASSYNFALDQFQVEAWADTFTEGGELRTNGETQCKGRPARMDFLLKAKARNHRSRHWTCNLVIDGDGSEARLRMYVLSVAITDGIRPYLFGEYDDALVKVEGVWRFKLRQVTVVTGLPYDSPPSA